MPKRRAEAIWNGSLKEGNGQISLGSGAYEGPYSYRSRFEDGDGTNPEELIGGAHAGCYSMALSMILGKEGYEAEEIHTDAEVGIKQDDHGVQISGVTLTVKARIPEITEGEFKTLAEHAKQDCPVSKVLAVPIELDATLLD
jgi:osmotically inducible protein OsmC